jgi:hypothetical protein
MFPGSAYRRYRRRQRRRRRLAVLALAVVVAFAAWAQHDALHNAAHTEVNSGAARQPGSHPSATIPPSPMAATVRWTNFHGIELPVSPQAGPHFMHNGLARGFTDTPMGAVLAAVNIGVRTAAQWGPGIYRPTIFHQVTGPDAITLLHADRRDYEALRAAAHVPPGQPAGRGYATEAAYRLLSYTPRAVTADIVAEGPAGNGTVAIAVTRVTVVWQAGDWRVVAPPDGSWARSATAASSLIGYTTFLSEG